MNKTEKRPSSKKAKFKRRDIDLLSALRFAESEKVREKKRGRPGWLVYFAAAAAVAAAGAGYALAAMQNSQLSDDNDQLLSDISFAKADLSEATQLSLKADWLSGLESSTSQQLAALADAGSQYGYYSSDLFTRIRRQLVNGVTIDSIELDSDTVTLSFIADKASSAAELVKRLREDEIFKWISYSGFNSGDDESEKLFSITCGLTDEKPAEEGNE